MLKAIIISAFLLLSGMEAAYAKRINKNTHHHGGIVATWYSHGKFTASGKRFNPNGFTVAHRTLPFGTKIRLTNPRNGKSIEAIVTDRGPFKSGIGLDVSLGCAKVLDFVKRGKTVLLMEIL